jgi:uncharacterized protein
MRQKMRILISGASGFIGSGLLTALRTVGHDPIALNRNSQTPPCWDPEDTRINLGSDHFDAVIHLAGESIASGIWTKAKKERLWQSRVQATQLLVQALSADPPQIFLATSAIGFYGDRGSENLDESSACGQGFLAELGSAWEEASAEIQKFGARRCVMRFGVVLDPCGGVLQKMLLPFRLGLGGRLGSGQQYLSWISRRDLIAAILFLLASTNEAGIFNLVAPTPVTNAEFTQKLAAALHRPAFLHVPAPVLRLLLGELANELLLASARVLPTHLQSAGFTFNDNSLEGYLSSIMTEKSS